MKIGDSNFFAGGVIVAGESEIGNSCFIGLGVTISHNLKIADKGFLGQGCVITKNTDANGTYVAASAIKQKFDSTRFCDLVF